jgi:hypothetical protein
MATKSSAAHCVMRDEAGCEQGLGVMLKTVYAIMVAAFAAACFVGFPSLSMQVEANSPVPGTKGDRADVRPLGSNCSQKAWPYFEASCLRDAERLLAPPREVRVIATVKAPGSTTAAIAAR